MGSRKNACEYFWSLLITIALLSVAHCQNTSEKELSKAANCFTYKLYQQLSKEKSSLVSSPYSLYNLLSILGAGAGGTTYKELTQGLGYEHLPESEMEEAFQTKMSKFKYIDNNTLDIATSLWAQKNFTINPNFIEIVTNKFNSEMRTVDFVQHADLATNEINDWGKAKTQGMIPKVFDEPLDIDTVLVLVNAVFFKGSWASKFNKDNTKPGPFRNKDSSDATSTVQLMHQQAKLMYHFEKDLNAHVLELFYLGENKSMVVILPNEGSTLVQMEGTLNCETFKNAIRPGDSVLVDLTMPKFDLSSTFKLEKPMKNLGMNDIFETSANLTGIAKGISVSKVIQKAIVEVYEEGTKAAAVTAVRFINKSAMILPKLKPVIFKADRPFLFLIRDIPTDLIIFIGRANELPSVP